MAIQPVRGGHESFISRTVMLNRERRQQPVEAFGIAGNEPTRLSGNAPPCRPGRQRIAQMPENSRSKVSVGRKRDTTA